jgi:two-component system, OmpR family, alkaline phosphatase synthesis response regulator PhoP
LANYRVFVDGSPVEFTFREHQLLGFLATNADRVFSREALLDQVWGCDYLGGARTVDVHIRRIRNKIERGGCTFIETVRSVGYRFHASPTA